MSRERIRAAVADLLPPEAFLTLEGLGPWPRDLKPPAAVVAPASEAELAALMKEAGARGWRVLPAGSGSWLQGWGGGEVELVVSTRRLAGMETYEPADLTFTAGAGMPFRTLQDLTGANGQWVPLDPPGARRGTLGALVANGVSGPLRQAYGAPRDHILGLTLVAGDGRILRWGGRVVKNVAGFDVTRLSIGSRGSLGIITSVSARLFPLPRAERTLLVAGGTAAALLPLARELSLSSMPLSGVELMEPAPALATGGAAPEGAVLLVRLLGTAEEIEEMEGRVGGMAREAGGYPVTVLDGEESRSFHRGLEDWEEGAALVLRLSLLPKRMADLLSWSREIPGALGMTEETRVERAGHVGWGVLRLAFRGEEAGGEEWESKGRTLLALRDRLEGEGGSLRVSQGPRDLFRVMAHGGEGGRVDALLRSLKKTFDPAGILAPGRLEAG